MNVTSQRRKGNVRLSECHLEVNIIRQSIPFRMSFSELKKKNSASASIGGTAQHACEWENDEYVKGVCVNAKFRQIIVQFTLPDWEHYSSFQFKLTDWSFTKRNTTGLISKHVGSVIIRAKGEMINKLHDELQNRHEALCLLWNTGPGK